VGFPRGANECDACHVGNTQVPPIGAGVLATTVDTQATVKTASPFGSGNFVGPDGAAIGGGDPSDDGNITATAAVCSACHDGTEALAHMRDVGGAGISDEAPGNVSSGAGLAVTQADVDNSIYVESCGVCHGSGREADVNRVHGLTQ
jgi:OmcA/MtrC family decaheme c-type cytochrome